MIRVLAFKFLELDDPSSATEAAKEIKTDRVRDEAAAMFARHRNEAAGSPNTPKKIRKTQFQALISSTI